MPSVEEERNKAAPAPASFNSAKKWVSIISKSFFQYILTSFPFPASIVQTDNDAVFAH